MQNSNQIEKTLSLLEFERIKDAVAACALSAESARLIREEIPLFDREKIRLRKKLVMSFCELIKNNAGEKRQEFPETGFLLPRLAVEGSVLDADEVLALGLFLERGKELKHFIVDGIEQDSADTDDLKTIAETAPDVSLLITAIFRIIDKDGTVRDLPEIKKIRRRIHDLGRELDHIAARFTGDETTRRMLQSALQSQKDGRLVLAVKANFRGRIKGIVHEVSATGQTVFVEPEESVEKNNQILIEKANLDAEIRRLLRELTAELEEHRYMIEEFHRIIVNLESLRARARYSLEIFSAGNGCCFAVEPKIKENSASLALKQARHPLLGKNAVPIDLSLEYSLLSHQDRQVNEDASANSAIRMVIITGPNTGGKTVTLKTIGLFALMNQAGLALPATEVVLPVFDAVYADIGDEQSLSQSLSTFSSHMINIAGIIKEATEQSLVLLDELGAGTDPEEGSAIAMSILDHFIDTKSTVVLTTHHGMLKNYGYSRAGVENASVEFDSRTLSPTYRIIMGIPGESRAVDIAARNGFPAALVEKARSYLDDERSDVSALIAALKEKHRELDNVSRSAKKEKEKLREDRRKTDLKALSLRQKEHFLKQEGDAEFRRFLSESRKGLENLVREIREGELSREKTVKVKDFIRSLETTSAAMGAVLDAEEAALAEMAAKTENDSRLPDTVCRSDMPYAEIMPGLEVLAGASRQRGIVIRHDNKKSAKKEPEQYWIVETGSVRMSFPERALFPVKSAAKSTKSQSGNKTVGWTTELAETSAVPKPEINLLGMRLEEALDNLRHQIDAAVLGGLREFAVIHGKSDGILQKGVHEYLRGDPAVADYYFSRPELGGFGRTEVMLK